MTSVYDSPRLAAAYASDRPPVHAGIIAAVAERLARMRAPIGAALDIGCGAGLSTAALRPLARRRVGVEPARAMIAAHERVAPGAHFVVGRAERLPFAPAAFDLLTAAGSLNYWDLDLALPEAARVLADDGVLVIYDFSGGRRLDGDARLEEWFDTFERRYPYPPGYPLDVRTLAWSEAGLRLDGYEDLEVAVAMSLDAYVAYAMSETNAERAIAEGATEEGKVREWCRASLAPIFAGAPRKVIFEGYAAYVGRLPSGGEPRPTPSRRAAARRRGPAE